MQAEHVDDLSRNPVEPLPPSPKGCTNCDSLRNLLSRMRTRMNLMESEIVNLAKKLQESQTPAAPESKTEVASS